MDSRTIVEDFRGRDPHFPGVSKSSDPLLLYFTSGTTALPKLVEHTHVSYPIGHLSTMYWMGLRPATCTSTSPPPAGPSTPGATSSLPGWPARRSWSTTTPVSRLDDLLAVLERTGVTTFCAPPTVWRMLIQVDLSTARTSIREALSAGEPLNPEVIEQVRAAWGITIRDGYGQTETTAQVGNPPEQPLRPGSMGRAAARLPGDLDRSEHGAARRPRRRAVPAAGSAAAAADDRIPGTRRRFRS